MLHTGNNNLKYQSNCCRGTGHTQSLRVGRAIVHLPIEVLTYNLNLLVDIETSIRCIIDFKLQTSAAVNGCQMNAELDPR